jgi:hypothetical protein
MSKADSAEKKGRRSKSKPKPGVMDDLLEFIERAVDNVDEPAAVERVEALREAHPEASTDEMVELLVRQKCMQTGAVGAITSGASMIPGLGTLVSLTFGVAADIGMTFKYQAELVLEIAAVYEHKLNPIEKRRVVMLITGLSAGANQAVRKASQRIAEKATERLAQKSVTKAIPVIGVAASAGTNILFTYVIGQRANAYFSLGPEAVGDWGESIRAVTGVDERIIVGWLSETTERSWRLVGDSAQSAVGSVIVAGKSAGEVIVVSADKVGEAVAGVGRGVAKGAGAVVEAGRKVGEGVGAGARKAGEAVADAGKGAAEGVAGAGKKTGEAIAAGAGKAGETAAGLGKGIGEGADAVKERASQALKVFKRGKARETEEKADEERAE